MKNTTLNAALALIAVSAVGLVLCSAGARVNTTKSIPIGLYWTSTEPVAEGTYVMFCPPRTAVFDEAKARGYIGPGACPGGFEHMMKRVAASQGDIVSVTGKGVDVNGVLLPLSVPVETDTVGRPLPRYRSTPFELGASELLLMSRRSATSFDGRYFGPVDRTQITGVVRPVITW